MATVMHDWSRRSVQYVMGVIIAFVTVHVTGLMQYAFENEKQFFAAKKCEYSTEITSSNKLNVLVSPLAFDDNGSDTSRFLESLYRIPGVNIVPLCSTSFVDNAGHYDIYSFDAALKASNLLKTRNSDILLVGQVLKKGESINVTAFNDHDGCGTPESKTISLIDGFLPNGFESNARQSVLIVAFSELSSFCSYRLPIDWNAAPGQMRKVKGFLTADTPLLEPSDASDLMFKYVSALSRIHLNRPNLVNIEEGLEVENFISNRYSLSDPNIRVKISVAKCKSFAEIAGNDKGKSSLNSAIEACEAALIDNQLMGNQQTCLSEILNNIAMINTKQMAWDRAVKYMTAAIENSHNPGILFSNLGYIYLAQNRYLDAIVSFASSINLEPNSITLKGRAEAYAGMGNFRMAIKDINYAIELDPGSTTVLNERNKIAFMLKESLAGNSVKKKMQ